MKDNSLSIVILTNTPLVSVELKSKKRDKTPFIPSTLWFNVASSNRFLSSDLPEGS
jgi:hypothetical protein